MAPGESVEIDAEIVQARVAEIGVDGRRHDLDNFPATLASTSAMSAKRRGASIRHSPKRQRI